MPFRKIKLHLENSSRRVCILYCMMFGVIVLTPQWLNAQTEDLAPLPWLSERVVDETDTLSVEEREQLTAKLAEYEQEKGSQIVVVLVPTTQPEAIEQYSLRLAEKWKIGREGVDDGVILLVAKQDRKLRIEVGYGLEGALPDATCKRIIDEVIVPEFKSGNFYAGIDKGVDRIIQSIRGEPLPETNRVFEEEMEDQFRWWNFWNDFSYVWLVICGVIGLFLIIFKKHLWALFAPMVLFGLPMLTLGIFFDSYFLDALLVLPIWFFAFLVLVGIFSPSTGGGSSGGSSYSGSSYSSSSYSGSSFSSSSSSSSSSSFSGGGGSFGGGGASGSW